jgi:hypothetical protein
VRAVLVPKSILERTSPPLPAVHRCRPFVEARQTGSLSRFGGNATGTPGAVRTLSALRETDPRLKRLLPQNRSVLAGSPCRRAAVADEPEDERHPCRARLAKASGVSRQIRGTAAKTSPALAKVDVWRGKHPGYLLPACGRLAQKGCKEAYCATAGVSQASLIVDSGGNAQLDDRVANCALRRATVLPTGRFAAGGSTASGDVISRCGVCEITRAMVG